MAHHMVDWVVVVFMACVLTRMCVHTCDYGEQSLMLGIFFYLSPHFSPLKLELIDQLVWLDSKAIFLLASHSAGTADVYCHDDF